MTLAEPVVCVVTRARGGDGSPERTALLDRLASAARAGASVVQIRERHFDDRALLAFTAQVIGAVRPAGSAVVVNDRTDVAIAAGADGVHLKSDGPDPREVRGLVPPGFLIGRSIHAVAEARAALACDYLLFGMVFSSRSKPADHPVAGLEMLAEVCRAARVPVLAIGGITRERAGHVRAAGAAGVAAISLFAEAPDIAEATRGLRDALTVPAGRV